MKYLAAVLIAPLGVLELALRLTVMLAVALTILGLLVLGEYEELTDALARPIILPAIAKAFEK